MTHPEKAGELSEATGLEIYPASVFADKTVTCALGRRGKEKKLAVATTDGLIPPDLEAEPENGAKGIRIGPLSPANARFLRNRFSFLRPAPGGQKKSVGCGDRLGLATPGHIRATGGSGLFPYLAQQSIREMSRTERTPQQVMDDALWGVLQAGYTDGFGSDADHLKTTEEIDLCLEAGFTMYTFDPGAYVDQHAFRCPAAALPEKVTRLKHESALLDFRKLGPRFLDKKLALPGGLELEMSEEDLARIVVKYGRAAVHAVRLYRHLAASAGRHPFEVELSVDETETPTTAVEHYFIADLLKQAGVEWVSLAPRLPGSFEKGVDYRGDPARLERALTEHRAVALAFGDYKISIHSGSDKFSVYPVIARVCRDRVHLKTAGTSYLEALRVVAVKEPVLFGEILRFARERYPTDRASYHVSADPAKIPGPETLPGGQMTKILDQLDARQVLHVTFGSVLTARDKEGGVLFREALLDTLQKNETTYRAFLEAHLKRHVRPFQ